MIRKLLLLGGLTALVRWFLARRETSAERVTIGYADGSAVHLEPGAPGYDAILGSAREALAP